MYTLTITLQKESKVPNSLRNFITSINVTIV